MCYMLSVEKKNYYVFTLPYFVLMAEGKMKWLNLLKTPKTSFQCLICHFLLQSIG